MWFEPIQVISFSFADVIGSSNLVQKQSTCVVLSATGIDSQVIQSTGNLKLFLGILGNKIFSPRCGMWI